MIGLQKVTAASQEIMSFRGATCGFFPLEKTRQAFSNANAFFDFFELSYMIMRINVTVPAE